MRRFVHRENIKHYQRLLEQMTDEGERKRILKLLGGRRSQHSRRYVGAKITTHWAGLVSRKGDEYRKRAEEADALAKASFDLKAVELYQDVAGHYRKLAAYEDRQDAWSQR